MFFSAHTTASTQNRHVSVFTSKYPRYARSTGTIALVISAARSAITITAFRLANAQSARPNAFTAWRFPSMLTRPTLIETALFPTKNRRTYVRRPIVAHPPAPVKPRAPDFPAI